MIETPHYSFNAKPRFSVNHLAEYLCARTAPKRTSIIRAAKFPRKPTIVAYTQAKPAICRFLSGNSGDLTHFDLPLERLAAKARRETGYARDEALRCHAALKAFKEAFKKTRAKRYTFTPGPQDVVLPLEGVIVNVRMDAGVIETGDDTANAGGCALFLAASAEARRNIEDRRKHVAAIIHYGLDGGQMEPLPRLCMSFDVFGGKMEKAPTAYERLRENMHHSCGEVAHRWDDVEPPDGYDGPDWR